MTGDEPVDRVGENVDSNPKTDDEFPKRSASWRECLHDILEFYYEQLNMEIQDHTEDGSHSKRPTTARQYFENVRGWRPEIINEKLLGWAPPGTRVLDHLIDQGYSREEILATGLFTENLQPLWQGRYVLPYFDRNEEAVYAISRSTGREGGGKAGYDGHPADFISGKYGKPAHTKDYSEVDEPIYGTETIEDGQPLLITEGIADAITAHQAGYPCISPVTTRFKRPDHAALLDIVERHEVPRVYIVQDSEAPQSEPREVDAVDRITDALTIHQHGPGLSGAVDTGAVLKENGVDARIAELPLPSRSKDFNKVDLDDYLNGWSGDLTPVLASATPVTMHSAYDTTTEAETKPTTSGHKRREKTGQSSSTLFELDIHNVTGLSDGYRGESPLGHHGSSRNYFVVGDGFAHDHKYKVGYNALTYLLCEAGIRRDNDPTGSLSNREMFEVWAYAKQQHLIPDDDSIPYPALLHVAVEQNLCEADDLPNNRESLPQSIYNATLRSIETEYDLDPGRDYVGHNDHDETDPTDLSVTLDPSLAWRAASAVTPEDLSKEIALETTADEDAWLCPVTGGSVDVVRAVGIEKEIISSESDPLCDADYAASYRTARGEYDAPLPEYVTAETVTDRWHVIQGVLEQLTHRHLSQVKSEVTGFGDERIVAELNPCWVDSASEKRIIAFENGGFYCRKHERKIDPLRLVALESGIIDSCDGELTGQAFKRAYQIAREEYGAPLPEWNVGNPEHIAVLPPAETLVGEFSTEIESLNTARREVEERYRNLADDPGTAHVFNPVPATGKTTAAIKNANEYPTFYLGPRKELQKEVAEKAERYDVSYYHLPVFAERHITEEARNQALAIVREEGKDVLKDREELASRLSHPIFPPDDESGGIDEDDLPRASCPTANGAHGEAWALVLQVARELESTPKDILTRSKTLFGEEIPGEGKDPYTKAWERVTDVENPVDLLIGSYGHAYVGGARTYYEKVNDRVNTQPRAVVVDEFPDLDPYEATFGERYLDHAAWLATCLRDDVDDRQALFANDLWGDEWVRSWLEGNGTVVEDVEQATVAFETMQMAFNVLEDLSELEETNTHAVDSLGLSEPLQAVQDCHPEWNSEAVEDACQSLGSVVTEGGKNKGTGTRVLDRVATEILPDLKRITATRKGKADPLPTAAIPSRVSGDLRDLCETSIEAFEEIHDEAQGLFGAAQDALAGGDDGCRALAIHARDGYAHPSAHLLLYGQLADGDDVETVRTEAFTFGDDDETNLNRIVLDRTTIIVDRNHHGALIHQPPEFVSNSGEENAIIGLDATANQGLWSHALGRDIETADIHQTPRHRRQFLRNVLNIQVVQTTPDIQSYSGNPSGKNFDGDVSLVETVADEYSCGQLRQDKLTQATKPGVITTKKVRQEIEDRLEGSVKEIDNYGNVTGSNALGECNVGVVLGARHYGDHYIEKWGAIAGEEVTRSGHGNSLDYGCQTANAALKHMRHDQTMQAILRFGRDEEGAIVFAHTSALRDDLPVVGEGAVVRAHSKSAKAIAKAATQFRRRAFNVSDLVDDVDCSCRTIRRVLARFSDAGYLKRHETKNGVANEYRMHEDPGTGDVELPNISLDGDRADETATGEYYTWNVRVDTDEMTLSHEVSHSGPVLPAPRSTLAGPPPG